MKPTKSRSLPTTGQRQTLVRHSYSDFDTLGGGNFAAAATGSLDAPDLIPQGSTRLHNTMTPNPSLSVGHRDWASGHMAPGAPHDGPEPVPPTLYLHREHELKMTTEDAEAPRRARP